METKFEVSFLTSDGILDQLLDPETGAPVHFATLEAADGRGKGLIKMGDAATTDFLGREGVKIEEVYIRKTETVKVLKRSV